MIIATRCFVFLIFIFSLNSIQIKNIKSGFALNQSWAQEYEVEDFEGDEDFEEDAGDFESADEDFESAQDDEESSEDFASAEEGEGDDDDFGSFSDEDNVTNTSEENGFEENVASEDDFDGEGDFEAEFNEDVAGDSSDDDNFDAFDEESDQVVSEGESDLDAVIEPEPETPSEVVESVEPYVPPGTVALDVVSSDNYDRDYENRLFKIYEDFYKYPVAESEWRSLTGDRKSEVYEVQKADTLWDISTTFFGDGHYWPKIWSVNSKITNPHRISEGYSILFNLGDLNSPPSFTVSDSSQSSASGTLLAQDGKSSSDVDGINENLVASNEPVKIPPTRLNIQPVIKSLPGSLPAWGYYGDGKNGSFDSEARNGESLRPLEVTVSSFVRDKKMLGVGKIIEAEAGEKLATTGQYVYVELKSSSSEGTFLVVSDEGVQKPKLEGVAVKGPFGHVYKVQGVVQLRSEISDKKYAQRKDGVRLYRAYVESAFDPLQKGGLLLNQDLQKVTSQSTQDFNFTSAQITGGSGTKKARVLGQGMFAFINKGSVDGFVEGDSVAIIANRKLRRAQTKLLSKISKVGTGKIVDVSEHVATLLITDSVGVVMVGDYLGEPQLGLGSVSNQKNGDDQSSESEFGDFDSFSDQLKAEDPISSDENGNWTDEVGSSDDDFNFDDKSSAELDEDIDFDDENDFSEGDIDSEQF